MPSRDVVASLKRSSLGVVLTLSKAELVKKGTKSRKPRNGSDIPYLRAWRRPMRHRRHGMHNRMRERPSFSLPSPAITPATGAP